MLHPFQQNESTCPAHLLQWTSRGKPTFLLCPFCTRRMNAMWEVANLGTPWLGQAMKWYCVTLNGSVSSSSACNEQKDERVRSLITVHSKAGPAVELFDHVPGPSPSSQSQFWSLFPVLLLWPYSFVSGSLFPLLSISQ